MNKKVLSFYQKFLIHVMIITLVGGGILSGFTPSVSIAEAEGINDPWLDQWLPTPGVNNGNSPFVPQSQGGMSGGIGSIPQNTPVWGGTNNVSNPSSGRSLPEEPIILPKGSVVVKEDDFFLPSYGFPITVQRLYQTEQKEQLTSFGYGWASPYDHYIQMFSDFTITEFRADGSTINYTFEKDDPNLLVPRFYVSTSKSILKALINMRSFEIQLSPIG